MKAVWHIVRKDLVRLRWILVLWSVVLGGGLALTVIQAGLDHVTYLPFYVGANVFMSGLVPLIAFGLVMGLLHDDSVAEIDAFWITRPISGGTLLLAKALGWLLLGLIPILVTLPFWLNYDYSWAQIAVAAKSTLRMHFIIAALALPFAVMSANGSKFVMNLMVGVGVLLLLIGLYNLGDLGRSTAPGLMQSKAWLLVWLWAGTAVTVTLNQFLRRRTRQSLAILTIAVAAGFLIAKKWGWELDAATGDPAVASTARSVPTPAVFQAKIDGAIKRTIIVAEVPLRTGASVSHEGMTLKIQSALCDWTGLLEVSFTKTTPRLSESFRDLLPGAAARIGAPEYFFVLNRSDGRAFALSPARHGNELEVATLGFSHLSVSTRPANAWQGSAPPNLTTWLQGALLVRVVVDDSNPPSSRAVNQ